MKDHLERKIGPDTPAHGYEVSAAFGGESPAMFTAAKAAGYVPLFGRKTTLRHYTAWRKAHPDFTSTAYVVAHSKHVRQRMEEAAKRRGRGLGQRRRGRLVSNAGKSDAQ